MSFLFSNVLDIHVSIFILCFISLKHTGLNNISPNYYW
uniref:Uncharacterized protein n=1 Tax=Anguilla anguilla TaxID=7936 RepID=A0A0E9PFS3_ANGAN